MFLGNGVDRRVISTSLRSMKRVVASTVATVLVALSVCVPLLDRDERARGPVLESEHSAATCVQGHDHSVCTQFSVNRLVAGSGVRPHGTTHEGMESVHLVDDATPSLVLPSPHNSRAPPLG